MHDIDPVKKRAEVLLETLNFAEAKNQKLGSYSTGMCQCLSLASTIIHQLKVLFLDEPTSGLDPESAKSVNCLIQSLANKIVILLVTGSMIMPNISWVIYMLTNYI